VRFHDRHPDGQRVYRSIGLGTDPAIAQRARELLATWQEPRDPRRAIEPGVREHWRFIYSVARIYKNRDRAAFLAHFLAAGNNFMKQLVAAGTWPAVYAERVRRRRGGRPRRGRLMWFADQRVADGPGGGRTD
jgi:hypothetical protein